MFKRAMVLRWSTRRLAAIVCSAVLVAGAYEALTPATADAGIAATYSGPVVQVGASNNDSNQYNSVGAEAYLGHVPSQYLPDGAGLFYWVAMNLPDNTFMQVGWLTDSWGCPNGQYEFFVSIWPQGNGGMAVNWPSSPTGYCGQSIPTYANFQIKNGGPHGAGGNCTWSFITPLGTSPATWSSSYCDTGGNRPGVVIELSGSSNINLADSMGPAGADPAILAQHTVGGTFQATAHATAYYTSDAVGCPGGATVVGKSQGWTTDSDHAGMGTSLGYSCTTSGASLW